MTDPRFIGLVQSLLASAQSALGEPHAVMGRRLEASGAKHLRTARRSLDLLRMLSVKTAGNLDDTERSSLRAAIHDVETRLQAAEAAAEAADDARRTRLDVILPGEGLA